MDAPHLSVDVVALDQVRLDDLPDYAGDPVLERMLERLQRQVKQAAEPVSGFSSAI